MYCILCEQFVDVEMLDEYAHLIPNDVDFDVCFGPFTTCHPPEQHPILPPEPDEEFMELIEGNYNTIAV